MKYSFSDFTEDEYRRLIKKAKNKASFISYRDFLDNKFSNIGNSIIWRHDIDISVNRALRMAEIEAEEGVKSVFFVLFSSTFYNVFENDIMGKLKQIISLGHEIGIHLDMDMYPNIPDKGKIEKDLDFLSDNIQYLFGVKVSSFSFHNPTPSIMNAFTGDYIGQYINAYSKRIIDNVAYCSDSNGYWRHQSIDEFLDKTDYNVACVLTHPVWWTPESLSPRERVQRAIDGRRRYVGENYDNLLDQFNRKNIK